MTEKRFEVVMNEFDEVEYIMDKEMMEDRDFADFMDFVEEVCKENEQLKFENNELKCALALDGVDYIIADGKKIDIPPYYEFEQRYDSVMHRREYDGYD